MGAEPWSLPELLFLMIPRFLPIRGARECATPTTPVHAGIRTRVFMLSNCGDDRPRPMRASVEPAHGGTARLIRPPTPRHRTTHRGATDLELEADRFRRGVRPISARVMTDLAVGSDRFRRGTRPISTEGGAPVWCVKRWWLVVGLVVGCRGCRFGSWRAG